MADAASVRIPVSGDYYGTGATFDNYGSQGDSAFIPQYFSTKVLEQFYNESTAVQLCNMDYEGEIKSSGDSVVVRRDPTISVSDYSIGATLNYEVPTEDAQTMYIDQAKYTAFKIDTIDDLQSDIGLPNRFQESASLNMKETIDKEIFEYMIGGATGATDMSAALFDAANIGATAGAVSGDIDLGQALG